MKSKEAGEQSVKNISPLQLLIHINTHTKHSHLIANTSQAQGYIFIYSVVHIHLHTQTHIPAHITVRTFFKAYF